ncbi:hypothetical protein P167DRAFT_484981, partial [Morchella conica CCBAS932]
TDIATGILTLYTGEAARGDEVSGLLYVPSVNETTLCPDLSMLPANVTHKDDLPNANYDLIGFAPWISGNCSELFLKAARQETSSVKGFVFFTTSENDPIPSRSDPMWAGISYKNIDFPIYAIRGHDGYPLMDKVAEYSGNMSDAWEARNLTNYYNSSDYARVYMEVDTGQRIPLPGLWLFLLVVLAVLIVIVGLTSLSMHWLQYQHRQRLRRRVASGQVDLEALGIKRLSVPRKILDQFPLRIYVAEAPAPTNDPISPLPPVLKPPPRRFAAPDPPLPPTPVTRRPPQYRHLDTTLQRGYSQTQCPICLEDFANQTTLVRELPCLHVFHPECIDPFLETQSSLCPLCKTSTLPQGYVPTTLTNATVRRERNLRRMRARVDTGGGRWSRLWGRGGNDTEARALPPVVEMRESIVAAPVRRSTVSGGGGAGERSSLQPLTPPSHEDEIAEVNARPKCMCPNTCAGLCVNAGS